MLIIVGRSEKHSPSSDEGSLIAQYFRHTKLIQFPFWMVIYEQSLLFLLSFM